MRRRKEFRRLVTVEEVSRLIEEHFSYVPKTEEVPIEKAIGRILAEDISSEVDVPSFDRAMYDGYAMRAVDTFGADEENPAILKVIGTSEAGRPFRGSVSEGEAVEIATGAVIPPGANAVVPVERTQIKEGLLLVFKSVSPGANIQGAGTDIAAGETLLRSGTPLGPREIGLLAAIGRNKVKTIRRPIITIFSTGDELVSPGNPLDYGKIYDINSYTIATSVWQDGGEPRILGILPDKLEVMLDGIKKTIKWADMLIISGSTSAGAGDVVYRAIEEAGKPGILVHGVAMKPGKPFVLGVIEGKFVVGLPGYPTSSLITYRKFVSPIIRRMAGIQRLEPSPIKARMGRRVRSSPGRRNFLPVAVLSGAGGEALAFPIPTGSEAITTLSRADGYVEIPENVEYIDKGEVVLVIPFQEGVKPADLGFIGSHCPGANLLLSILAERENLRVVCVNVGSLGGFEAIRSGEADVSGVHALDPRTGTYNISFLDDYSLKDVAKLVRGYGRVQGLIVAEGNPKGIKGVEDLLREDVRFVNRNRGSGTRILLDHLLSKLASERKIEVEALIKQIKGYRFERKTHSGVAEAVARGEADVGFGIEYVARIKGLDFIPLTTERYDFLIRKDRLDKRSVKLFLSILRSDEFKNQLSNMPGYLVGGDIGSFMN
ncbi:MAG TPA: molybdopterin biosynthesis protein [Candidatus Korarchaeota archaeon]|nr:molybdopterin biosynthesis protein [Candidatus Korarchaeota archaeon]